MIRSFRIVIWNSFEQIAHSGELTGESSSALRDPVYRMHESLCAALSLMTNLHTLDIQAQNQVTGTALALARHAAIMPFKLSVFSTNVYIDEGLVPFLHAQPRIHTFRHDQRIPRHPQLNPRLDHLPSANEGFLPELKSITYIPHLLPLFAAGRPIENIATLVEGPLQIDQVVSAIEKSAARVKLLDITLKPNTLSKLLLERLSVVNRRSLQLADDGDGGDLQLGCPAETIVLGGISPPHGFLPAYIIDQGVSSIFSDFNEAQGSGFPNLSTLYWRGDLRDLLHRDPEIYAPPSLKEVRGDVIGPRAAWEPFSRVLREDGEWTKPVHSKTARLPLRYVNYGQADLTRMESQLMIAHQLPSKR